MIYIIYTYEQRKDAEEILHYLVDENWYELHEEMRMIPVSGTRNADYTDPKMVPEKIREVNR